MASSNACWGIEIGSGAVKAVKVVLDGDQLTVADFAYIPHSRVLSTPDMDQDDAKRVALGRLVSEYDLSKATIAVSVPGHSAFARFAKLPPVEPKKVPDIVKFEAQQQIPFPLDEVEWDYQTFVSPDSPEVEVGIFAITKQRIASELAILHDVNLTPDVVTLSPVAVYNSVAYDLQFTEDAPSTILLDVGTTSTDLIIADAGRVWVRTFPIGGHEFTNALVEAFKLSYPKAEKLKREAEQSKHARHVFQALRPVFSDLVQDVQRSIGYYQSMHPDANLERLVGMGSTFQLPGLRKYLKQQLGMNVYRLEKYKKLTSEGPRAAEFEAHSLNFATAYGLALQGLGMATLEANLMPVEVTKKAMWASKGKWFAAAAGLALAATGAMFIRPFMDSQYTNMPVPAEIREATNRAQTLSNEARSAGVTADVTRGDEIASLMSLAEGKDVHLRLLDDVNAILVDASEQAGDAGRGYKLLGMYTHYLYGNMPIPKPGAPQKRTSGRNQGNDFMMSEEATIPGLERERYSEMRPGQVRGGEPRGGAAADEGVTDPRIAVTLDLSTLNPVVEVFVEETVKRWVEQNADRLGLPYHFTMEDFEWEKLDTIQHAALDETPAGRPGRAAGRNDPRRGNERAGGRRYLEEGGGEATIPGLSRGGGGGNVGNQQLPQDAAQALTQLDQFAPIVPSTEGLPPPGSVETILRVTFVAVLGEAGAENGEEE